VKLVGGFSATSGHHHFPLADVCPYTGASDVVPVDLPTTGRLWLWTVVTASPPGYDGPVPYGLGIVVLDGVDLRVAGRLTVDELSQLTLDQPMALVEDPSIEGMWAWSPA
jgi:uncharacterized OB-fold protein